MQSEKTATRGGEAVEMARVARVAQPGLPRGRAALLLIFCCSLLAAGCGDGEVEAPRSVDDAPASSEESAARRPDLSYPGEELATAVPESPAEAPPEPAAASDNAVPPPAEEVRIFLVELEAGGAAADGGAAAAGGDTFGCGDRLRPVAVPVATEGVDTAGRIAAAVGSLLAADGGRGLYSALEGSDLAVERVEPVAGVAGLFRIHLTGQLRLGGVCDNPRVRAQLEATARQFAGVDDVEIELDGQPLESLLSGRG
jgi:hypothetical protein